MPLESLAQAMNRISAEVRGGPLSRMARGGPVRMADGGAVYDPMGNVAVPPSEGFAPSPAYENIADAVARAGSAVGSPVVGGLQTAGRVYADKSREAAAENEALRQQAMRNMAGDRAGMVPVGAGQMLLSQLGTATLPLTAAAKTAGYAATQGTGNPRFGENVELLSGFVDPSHVGMLKATAPMAGAAAVRQAVQAAREVAPVAQAARELSPMGLYSHGAETAAGLQQAKGSPEQMAAMLRRSGVKPEELYTAGIADEAATLAKRAMIESEYAPKIEAARKVMEGLQPGTKEFQQAERQFKNLQSTMRAQSDSALALSEDWAKRPTVTREEITQHFREQMPVVEERVLGTPRPEQMKMLRDEYARAEYGEDFSGLASEYKRRIDDLIMDRRSTTKFGQYTLPGGENYREIALTLPGKEIYRVPEAHSMGDKADINRIVHIRTTDRTGPNGEKVLHVEELQSDWGQQGKKAGFITPETAKQIELINQKITDLMGQRDNLKDQLKDLQPKSGGYGEPLEYPEHYTADLEAGIRKKIKNIENEVSGLRESRPSLGLPSAPYVTSTEGWTDLALKRVLKEAAEGGYDKVVWTPGAEQAKRYSLSNQVRSIDYMKEGDNSYRLGIVDKRGEGIDLPKETFTAKELEDYLGRDVASKIINDEGQSYRGRNHKSLEGVDLVLGGEGMKGYYDKIVPKRLQDIARRHDKGAKIEQDVIDIRSNADKRMGLPANQPINTVQVPSLTITPAMRESILRGQPHMAEGGAVENEEKDLMDRLRGHLKRNMVEKLMKDLRRALRDHHVRGRS